MKVGIIGKGRNFDLHVLGYLENNDTDLVAFSNISTDKATTTIEKFNIDNNVEIYTDYKGMIKNERLDLIEILLPGQYHAEVTDYGAKKGVKGISVDKPIALSLKDAEQMIQVCKKNNVTLSIYENFYFAPHIQRAKSLVDNDYIGEPTSIRIKTALGGENGYKLQESSSEQDSLIMVDIGWHSFALASLFFKEKIRKVFAWNDEYQGLEAPAYVMFQYEQTEKHPVPQYGNFEFSYMPKMKIPSNYYPIDEFIEIIGTRGLMKINQVTSIGNAMTESEAFDPLIIVRDGKVESYDDFPNDWKNSFINATQHFISAVKGEARPILDGQTAKEILKFNLAAIQSSQKGLEIHLNEK